MTKAEIISFRCSRPKRELRRRLGANISKGLNALIERELSKQPPRDWREILDRDRPKISGATFQLCMNPE